MDIAPRPFGFASGMTSIGAALAATSPPLPVHDGLYAALRQASGAQALSEAALLALAQLGHAHAVPAKACVLQRGQPAHALWLLTQGTVCVGNHDSQGHWWQTHTVEAHGWIDLSSAWLDGPYLETALAQTAVWVHEFPVEPLAAVAAAHPEVSRWLLGAMAATVRRLGHEVHDLLAKDVMARCAGWLLDSLEASEVPHELVLQQHKRFIASQLGTSPETFSRTLRQLREIGAVEIDRYRIRVHDVPALQRLSGRTVASPA
nr:Crp/Fnr family transcriptional regulator [uncultured Roseateles sp.]